MERRVIGAVEPGDDGLGDADRCLELAQLAEACALQNRLVALDDFDGHELVGTGMQRFIQRCGLLIHGLGLWVVGTSAGEQPLQMLQCFVDLAASREDDCCVVHRQVDEAAHVRPCIVREPRDQSAVADERLAVFPARWAAYALSESRAANRGESASLTWPTIRRVCQQLADDVLQARPSGCGGAGRAEATSLHVSRGLTPYELDLARDYQSLGRPPGPTSRKMNPVRFRRYADVSKHHMVPPAQSCFRTYAKRR